MLARGFSVRWIPGIRRSMSISRRAELMQRTRPEKRQRMAPRQGRPERITPVVLPARPGDETETAIERIVPGGFGLGFGGGRTLFVSRAAPGDRLRVRIDREHGRVAHASIVDILEAGPDRVPEAHPLLSRCGADFQHLRYDAQLAAKSGIIADSLRRIGGGGPPASAPPAPPPPV